MDFGGSACKTVLFFYGRILGRPSDGMLSVVSVSPRKFFMPVIFFHSAVSLNGLYKTNKIIKAIIIIMLVNRLRKVL